MSTVNLSQYSKSRVLFVKLAVLCIFLMKAVSVINVVLGNITKFFADVDPALISAISTVPVVFMFIMSLLSGKITQKFDKKNVLIVALVIFIIVGVGNYFVCENIYQMLAMRALLGVGVGLSAPLAGVKNNRMKKESKNMRLEGKVAIVTGASSGIGYETARIFAQEGAKLVLTARRKERLEARQQSSMMADMMLWSW